MEPWNATLSMVSKEGRIGLWAINAVSKGVRRRLTELLGGCGCRQCVTSETDVVPRGMGVMGIWVEVQHCH